MNKILLLLTLIIFQNNTFCQKKTIDSSFSISNKKVVWSKIYKSENKDVIKLLKSKLILNFNADSTGTAKDLKLLCKNISIYSKNNFSIIFKIEFKENMYKVTATNFIFENQNQLNVSELHSELKYFNIENYILTRELNFKNDGFNSRTTTCLNNFLSELFSIENIQKW